MGKWIKKAWEAINGHKTTIGTIIYLASKGGEILFPDAIPHQFYEAGKYAGEIIMGGGLMHKGIKSNTVNNAIKNGTKRFKKK